VDTRFDRNLVEPARSGSLRKGAAAVRLTNQGQFDPIIQTAHLGILNSPVSWAAALGFLRSLEGDDD